MAQGCSSPWHKWGSVGAQWKDVAEYQSSFSILFEAGRKINYGGLLYCEQVIKRVKRCSNIPIKTQQPSEYGSCSLLMRIKSRIEDFNMVPRLDVNYVAKKEFPYSKIVPRHYLL